jgi:hypothetical protein
MNNPKLSEARSEFDELRAQLKPTSGRKVPSRKLYSTRSSPQLGISAAFAVWKRN